MKSKALKYKERKTNDSRYFIVISFAFSELLMQRNKERFMNVKDLYFVLSTDKCFH